MIKTILKTVLIFAALVLYTGFTQASTLKDCQGKLEAARASLLALKGGKKDADQQSLVKKTAEETEACMKTLEGQPKLKELWGKFYDNRVHKLVPAILADDKKVVEDIGSENAQLYSKMMQIFHGE